MNTSLKIRRVQQWPLPPPYLLKIFDILKLLSLPLTSSLEWRGTSRVSTVSRPFSVSLNNIRGLPPPLQRSGTLELYVIREYNTNLLVFIFTSFLWLSSICLSLASGWGEALNVLHALWQPLTVILHCSSCMVL